MRFLNVLLNSKPQTFILMKTFSLLKTISTTNNQQRSIYKLNQRMINMILKVDACVNYQKYLN